MTNEKKTQDTKHTPTPWKMINDYEIVTQNNRFISTCLDGSGLEGIQDKYNAEFIVAAVNSHDQIIQCAKSLIQMFDDKIGWAKTQDDKDYIDDIRNILAKAEGK